MSDNLTHHYFEYEGVRLHYVAAGSGPLLIFYHGFPLFWFSFHHQLNAFKRSFRVVAVDGPGVNLSSKPDDLEHYRLPELTAQLDALARHLNGDEPFTLIGHDWGGALAWSYAQHLPHRLQRLIVLNAPPTNQLLGLLESDPEQRKRSAYMYSMREGQTHQLITENGGERLWRNAYAKLRGLPHYTDEHDQTFREGLAQPGAINGAINWYRANIPPVDEIEESHFWPSRHARTSVPALLVWGETDQTFVPRFIDELPRYADNLSVCRLPDIGHTPMLEDPETLTDVVRQFLTTH